MTDTRSGKTFSLTPWLVVLAIGALTVLPNPVSADFTWQETVILPSFPGNLRDAAYDSSGVLHLAIAAPTGELVHGEWSGGPVAYDTLHPNQSGARIKTGSNGLIGILFPTGLDELWFACRKGSTWSSARADSNRIHTFDFAFDSNGDPHVGYSTPTGHEDAYYCERDSGGAWNCTQLNDDTLYVSTGGILSIGSGDSASVYVSLAGPADWDQNSVLLRGALPLPVQWDTVEATNAGWAGALDARTGPGGEQVVLTRTLNYSGVDCQDSDLEFNTHDAGWMSAPVSAPGQYPFDRYSGKMDLDSQGTPHAIFKGYLQDYFCDPCAMYCQWGFPDDPQCYSLCDKIGLVRYSYEVGSVRVQEYVPDSDALSPVLLDLDANDIPRIVAKRGNEIVLLSRDLSTEVEGEAGGAGSTDALPASGLRVVVSPNPSTRAFSFAIAPGGELARVDVFDIRGRLMRSIAAGAGSGSAVAGESRLLTWDGTDASGRPVAKGVYFARFDFGARTETHKLTVVR